MAEHSITEQGNSGLRNGILHARHLQATGDNVFYYILPYGQGFFGRVAIQNTPPMWYDVCVAVPPLGEGEAFYIHGADSCCHVDIQEYIKWIRYLIDNSGINW